MTARSTKNSTPKRGFSRGVKMEAVDQEIEILKKMSPAQKLRSAGLLYWSARQLKKAWLNRLHPDWSSSRLEEEVKKAFLYART